MTGEKLDVIERIVHDGRELALILRATFRRDGIEFFTASNASQQLGYMHRPAGHVIPPHLHQPVPRTVIYTKEVLFVRSGRVRVDFYDDARAYLESTVLFAGDVVLLAEGGHGFEMLEPTEMIEVKQGPYVGEQDKIRFAPADPAQIRIRGGTP
jgi:mannose-6-phosphate isomerase-like protein (cupin superfamily)